MGVEIEISTEKEDGEEKEYGKWNKWEIESAARTLLEAAAIKQDKEKMKYVAECMRKQADAMDEVVGSLDDLKKIAKKKIAEDSY